MNITRDQVTKLGIAYKSSEYMKGNKCRQKGQTLQPTVSACSPQKITLLLIRESLQKRNMSNFIE